MMLKLFAGAGMLAALCGCTFQPVEGMWRTTLGDVLSDDCELFGGLPAEDQGVELLSLVEGGFVYGLDDCTLVEREFVCARETQTRSASPLDAVTELSTSMRGVFETRRWGLGVLTSTLTCSGADCAGVEQVLAALSPCESSFHASLVWVEMP